MGNWTSTLMCTEQYCECPPETNVTMWEEESLNRWGRTKDPVLAASGDYVMFYVNLTGGYTTFKECYQHILELQAEGSSKTSSGAGAYVRELSDNAVRYLYI